LRRAAWRRTRFGQDDTSSLPSRGFTAGGIVEVRTEHRGCRDRDVPLVKSGLHPSVQANAIKPLSGFREIWPRAPAVSDRTEAAGEPVVSAAFFEKSEESPLFFLFEQSNWMSKKEPGLHGVF
jgi:hypothetical protein